LFASILPKAVFQAALTGATRNRGMAVIRCHPKTPTVQDIFAHTHMEFLHKDGYLGKLVPIGHETHWEHARRVYRPAAVGKAGPLKVEINGKMITDVVVWGPPLPTAPKKQSKEAEEEPDPHPEYQKSNHFETEPFVFGNITIYYTKPPSEKDISDSDSESSGESSDDCC